MDYTHQQQAINHRDVATASTIQAPRPIAFSPVAVDLIAGGVAGTASVIAGHPLDTIKVRVQLQHAGGIGSPSSWFRGLTAPLSAAVVVNALVFFGHGWSSRVWDDTIGANDENRVLKNFVCGSFGGFTNCFAICPMEHVKCRLQAQQAGVVAKHRGPLQVMSNIVSTKGPLGLFRGWHVTCWREIPAFGVYFALYDIIREDIVSYKRRMMGSSEESSSSIDLLGSILAGGTAGSVSWAIIYPLDVIKTRIQTSPLGSAKPEDRKIWAAGRHIVKGSGTNALFRGVGIAAFRAFPVNGIIFPMYEYTAVCLSNRL